MKKLKNKKMFFKKVEKYQPLKIPINHIVYFVIVQVITGFNLGFTNALKKKFRILLSVTQTAVSFYMLLVITLRLINLTIDLEFILPFIGAVQYLSYVLILNFAEYNLYHFYVELSSVKEKLEKTTLLLASWNVTFVFACKILVALAINTQNIDEYEDQSYLPTAVIIIPYYTIDVIPIIQAVIMYEVLNTLREMKTSMINKDIQLIEIQMLYKKLLDCYFKVRNFYNKCIIVRLVGDLLRLMTRLWTMLEFINQGYDWYFYVMELAKALILLFQLCVPAILCEMSNMETEEITSYLHCRLAHESDERKKEHITVALTYIEGRCLRQDIWSVIPVDIRLPIALISLCTTYLIVIIQFSHMYD